MATETYSAPLGELRAASAAGGGTALGTAAKCVPLPPGTQWLAIEGRNFTTAVVAKVALSPFLVVLVTPDALATAADYSDAAQDASAATDVVLSSLDTALNLDYVYLGSHLPFRGAFADVDATNANASALSGEYWTGSAWAALSGVSDGSAAAGATFAQDGAITWTVPADWAPVALKDAVATTGAAVPHRGVPLYWVRLKVSAALDASTTLDSLCALNRSTAYAELVSGRVLEMRVTRGIGGVGAVEALTDAGTASLIVNVASNPRAGFV